MRIPGNWTLEELFTGKPGALELFHVVRRYIGSIGTTRMDVTKTQVSFAAKTKFAWVWLPQIQVKNRPEESITLTFDLGRRIEDDRITEVIEPKPGRFTHHIVIEKESELDDEVREWLREAYELHK